MHEKFKNEIWKSFEFHVLNLWEMLIPSKSMDIVAVI